MGEQNVQEIWQVEVGGQIYEAAFAELGDWIAEGSLQPLDKVRKNNLRWIEARKVPYLIPFFNAKAEGLPMPAAVQTVDARGAEPLTVVPEAELAADIIEVPHPAVTTQGMTVASVRDASHCSAHPDVPAFFCCDGCGSSLCASCPKSYGASVKICPLWGYICRPISEIVHEAQRRSERAEAMNESFGWADFARAIAYPWNYKTSLVFGALMFAFFSIGKSVSTFGGIYMIVAAIFSMMLANMLTFGVLANTVENFSQGRLTENFMPNFDDFALWDDVVHPFFLSIGVYLTSFGPFILVMLVGLYLVMGSVSSHMEAMQSDLEKLPGTHYYDAQRTIKQSETVRDVVGDISEKQTERTARYDEVASGNNNVSLDPDEAAIQDLWNQAQDARKAQLESVIGKSPETQQRENEAMMQGFLNLAAPLVVVGAIFFLWGVFYFPAACAVAGYTRSFGATLSPAVGFDTIKRLGGSYIKLLLMGVGLAICSGIVGEVLDLAFSPFNLPGLGNIPAKGVSAMVTFYFSVVFSCVLGYALFKASDRLALPR